VIDGGTNEVIATVAAGNYPDALCYNPTDNKVYCSGSGNVTIIDGAADTIIATVRAGGSPLCYNSTNNKVYCAHSSGDSVTVIDGTTNAVIATVAVGDYFSVPSALCSNPADNKVYCANQGSDQGEFDSTVTVIDGTTNEVIATVHVGCNPAALCYNPRNNKVYCANTGDPTYSPSTTVTVIDGATNGVIATIGVGRTPCALAYNPTQNRVYVANYEGSSISVLRDSAGGMEESFKPQAAGLKPAPTIVCGVLFLQEASSPKPQAASMLDISGRKVLDLHPGANDVRALAPGVYFVREAQAQAVRKVVLTGRR
jgi:YVTN family beta-propeller protein